MVNDKIKMLALSLITIIIILATTDLYATSKTELVVLDSNDSNITLSAYVADTPKSRYTGLSDRDRLENNSSMLFVFNEEKEREFVMRDMDFPIDIAFIGSDCSVNNIYTAPEPSADESGTEPTHTYIGDAKYVLETNAGQINGLFDDSKMTSPSYDC